MCSTTTVHPGGGPLRDADGSETGIFVPDASANPVTPLLIVGYHDGILPALVVGLIAGWFVTTHAKPKLVRAFTPHSTFGRVR